MNWIISANSSIYDHADSFEKRGYIDWKQSANFEVGDTIFIYSTAPLSRLEYKCVVEKNNIPFSEKTDDQEFWIDKDEYFKSHDYLYSRLKLIAFVESEKLSLDNLKKHGLKQAPQRPTRLINERSKVGKYIQSIFEYSEDDIVYPDEVDDQGLYEGSTREVKINAYERNAKARKKCIDHFGVNCIVCGFNFEDKYGELGNGFIHVHHVIPLSSIGENYKINYKEDLVPVCPNCHAMLHAGKKEKLISIEQLRKLIAYNSK